MICLQKSLNSPPHKTTVETDVIWYNSCAGNVFVMAAILLDRHLQSVANYLILRSI